MNEKKTLIAIRKVLAQWNLSCAEESCLKKQLADELLLVVKNCNTPDVSKSVEPVGKPTFCPDCNSTLELDFVGDLCCSNENCEYELRVK